MTQNYKNTNQNNPITRLILLLLLVGGVSLSGWGQDQVWTYDFNVASATHSSGESTTFFPSTPAGGGTYRIRIGNAGGALELNGDKAIMSAATSTSANKVGVYGWDNPTSAAYVKFELKTSSTDNGRLAIALGNDGLVTNNDNYSGNYHNSLAIFWINYSSGEINSVQRRTGGSTLSLSSHGFLTDTEQIVEIYGNNSSAVALYERNDISYSLNPQSWDLWVAGTKISPDDGWAVAGNLAANADLSGFVFFGESSTANVATITLDDYEYANHLPQPDIEDPVLFADPGSIDRLSYAENNGPSDAVSFEVSGDNLDNSDLTINAPSNFEVSTSQSSGFSESIILSSYDGDETEIWVRLIGGLSPADYSGELKIFGGGVVEADATTVSLSGKVIEQFDIPYANNFQSDEARETAVLQGFVLNNINPRTGYTNIPLNGYIETPEINFTEFDYLLVHFSTATFGGSTNQELELQISTDGENYTELFTAAPTSVSYDENEVLIDLTGIYNEPSGTLRFKMTSGTNQTRFRDLEIIEKIHVSNIGDLRDGQTDGTIYKLTDEVILTFQSTTRNQKYIQDETGGILIDDDEGIITTKYNIYDGITGIVGTLEVFNDMLQFVPILNTPPATSSGNVVVPETVTLDSEGPNFLDEDYQGQLVRIVNVTIDPNGDTTFSSGKNYDIEDEDNNTGVLRTQYGDIDYIGEDIPEQSINLVGVVRQFGTAMEVIPRSLADFEDFVDEPLSIGSDHAGNYPETNNWAEESNEGEGFTAWSFNSSGGGGRYIGNSGLGDPTFAIFSGATGEFDQKIVSRGFSEPMGVGTEFSIDLGHTGVLTGGEIGINFFAGEAFKLNFKYVADDNNQWMLNDGGADFGTGMEWQGDTPMSFKLTRTGDNQYSLSIEQGEQSFTATNNTANSGTFNIDRLDIYTQEQGSGENFGFDNLSISNYIRTVGNGPWNADASWLLDDVPGEGVNAIIQHFVTINDEVSVNNLDILDGKQISINSDGKLTVNGTLTNQSTGKKSEGGRLLIQSDATSTGSLIHNTPGVQATAERYIAAVDDWETESAVDWHMIASPVAEQSIAGGWIAGDYDFFAWGEATGEWLNQKVGGNNITDFVPGQGYLVAYRQNVTNEFTGELNTGSVGIALSDSDPAAKHDWYGWNLLGNPYPSAIDWNQADRTAFEDNFVYVYDRTEGGVGVGGYVEIDGGSAGAIIPANQGFFVKLDPEVPKKEFQFTNDMRVHGGDFYKNQTLAGDLLKLRLANEYYDETTIRVLEGSGFERERTDALKLFSFASYAPQLYTFTSNNVMVAVNSIPKIEEDRQIRLGVRIPESGEYTLSVQELGPLFSNGPLYLLDNATGIRHNLNDIPEYVFTASAGTYNQRFRISFAPYDDDSVNIIDPGQENAVRIWQHNNILHVDNPDTDLDLYLYDISGRRLQHFDAPAGQHQFELNLPAGAYFVKSSGESQYETVKIIIK